MTEVPPVLLSSIVCERVIFDKFTGTPSLINVLQTINSPRFPMRCQQVVFFCELTDGHGSTNTKVKIVDAEDKAIFEKDGKVKFEDVKQVLTLAVNLQGIVFSKPGEYCFQLLAEERLLGERRVVCRQVKLGPDTTAEN